MLEILGHKNSILDQIIAELRDKDIQSDSLRFRKNMELSGSIMAYEISKTLEYKTTEVSTTLGVTNVPVLIEYPVLITILRAGLPLHQGLLSVFNRSSNGFISSYRQTNKNEEYVSKVEYISSPEISNKVIIVSDPVMATGNSVVEALKELFNIGNPSYTHIVTTICSEESIHNIKRNFSRKSITIWTIAVDDELTASAYLVPGLGDAGDLAFGNK